MKNLNIEQIAKIEKCECEEVCGACKEKYSNTFADGSPIVSTITGEMIGSFVLRNTTEEKSELMQDIEKIKEIISRIEKRERANQK